MSVTLDVTELKKSNTNQKLFSIFKTDHFEIDEVLKIINEKTLPVEIPINNNMVFIRDLTKYIVENNIDLKPNIDEKQ